MNFYYEAAKVLDKLDAKQGSIKGLLARIDSNDRKRMTAAVIETLKYKPVLLKVINAASVIKLEKKQIPSMNMCLVLVHDLLFARGIQAGDGPIKQAILRHKTRLHSELVKLKIKKGVKSNSELAQTQDVRADAIPRYVRVNTNVSSIAEVIAAFEKQKYVKADETRDPKDPKSFSVDEHIPGLLAFHPSAPLQTDAAYKNGSIIFQDKASCFPAVVLAPPSYDGAVVIDATAAPGNKTSHLSALMSNKGKIYAFERDRHRFDTLTMMLDKAHCKNVEPICGDFLKADPKDPRYQKVTHILLDPSCSGSGIVNRLDYLMDGEQDTEETQIDRLQKLAEFQLAMIQHAMKFPSAAKIVYSTCSIHPEEDEHVVQKAIKCVEALANDFKLAPRSQVLPQWHRRGRPEEMDPGIADCVVRCLPGEDFTNGFFVSSFIHPEIAQEKPIRSDSTKRKGEFDGDDKHDAPPLKKKKKRKPKGDRST